jgi:hypothetical protein
MKKVILLSSLVFLFLSCDSGSLKNLKKNSSGRINSVLVVLNHKDWQGKLGDSLRNILAKPLVGMPQSEPLFTLDQIDPMHFKSILKSNRNIIIIGYNDVDIFSNKTDQFAAPQRFITIKSSSRKGILKLLNKYAEDIVKSIKNSDLTYYRTKKIKSSWKVDKLEFFKENKLSMRLPKTFVKVSDTTNYLWFRREIPKGTLNIFMYTVPITSEDDENGENIIATRDLKGEQFIPGSGEGMYMETEKAYTPMRYDVEIDGKKAYETRGTWDMKKGFMAGPFLNYTVVDKQRNRLVVVEGFTFAPSTNKREYMFELECILKTLKIN